jgi:hypothetical protein
MPEQDDPRLLQERDPFHHPVQNLPPEAILFVTDVPTMTIEQGVKRMVDTKMPALIPNEEDRLGESCDYGFEDKWPAEICREFADPDFSTPLTDERAQRIRWDDLVALSPALQLMR